LDALFQDLGNLYSDYDYPCLYDMLPGLGNIFIHAMMVQVHRYELMVKDVA
jgi:hypothetical protein